MQNPAAHEPGSSEKPLAGQHAIVTGGSRGIGLAVAHELASMGAKLTLMGRDTTALESACAALRDRNSVECAGISVDMTAGEEAVAEAFKAAAQAMGRPSILVNNAGRGESAPFLKMDMAMWQRSLDLNLTGVFLGCRSVLQDMLTAGYGRIVNMASTTGLKGYPYISAYCASKHGVVGLTRALAMETARKGVTVNAVCPGYVETEMTGKTIINIMDKTGRKKEEARADLERINPQMRLIQPEEVASTVAWLCLPAQQSVTGQSIVIAGGEIM